MSITIPHPDGGVIMLGNEYSHGFPQLLSSLSNLTIFYYPAVRTGSSNTHFFSVVVFFFGGHLPQTSGFRSAKKILVVFFATQARGFILGDRNIFYTPPGGGGGKQRRGLMPLGLFLFLIMQGF